MAKKIEISKEEELELEAQHLIMSLLEQNRYDKDEVLLLLAKKIVELQNIGRK